MSKGAPGVRYAELDRETPEARVQIVLDLDGGSRQDVSTGIGFFDRMLSLMAFQGNLNLGITAEGNLDVDDLHTVEAVGTIFGQAIGQALAESDPIERAADNHTAVDDALVLVAVEVYGHGRVHGSLDLVREHVGELNSQSVLAFFRALSQASGMTIHIRKVAGENDHRICEAAFRGFGRALHDATRRTDRRASGNAKKAGVG